MAKGSTEQGAITSGTIASIAIESLFGRYNYHLKVPAIQGDQFDRVAMLYGDNGTGKTTILKMIFHLLSAARDQGHRGCLARTSFSRFCVEFTDKATIYAYRQPSVLTGPYTIGLTDSNGITLEGEIKPGPDGSVGEGGLSPEAGEVIDRFASLGLALYFLRDDRLIESDQFGSRPEPHGQEELEYVIERTHYLRPRLDPRTDRRDALLRESLDRASTWLRRELIRESTRGEAEAQQIYALIAEKINRVGPRTGRLQTERRILTKELKELADRSASFARYGLMSKVDAERFIATLDSSNSKGLPFVGQVVRSFINGQKARLDALQYLQRRVVRFETLINGFLKDKSIRISADEGIAINSDTGVALQPQYLSSGEKQLLILFSSVLASGESASLFIIDEPELSLNVKWQRNLVESLIEMTLGSACQFLMATHSIELLAKHRERVIKLDPE